MNIYNNGYTGNSNQPWTKTTDVDEAVRRMPIGQDEWTLFRYCIINNHKYSTYVNKPLEKWNKDMIIKLLDKYLSKEDVLKFLSDNNYDLVCECYSGTFNVLMEKLGSKEIIDIFKRQMDDLEYMSSVTNGSIRLDKYRYNLCEVLKTLKNKQDIESLVDCFGSDVLIKWFKGRLEHFPDNIKYLFTDLDYNGNKSNVRLASIKHWKDAETIKVALDLIPQSEMGEAIDYYMKNKPYLAKSFYSYISGYILEKILLVNYESYPEESKKIVDRIFLAKQKREEDAKKRKEAKALEMENMENEKSKAEDVSTESVAQQEKKTFFKLYNGQEISSDQDCLMVAQRFIEENMSVDGFCKKYKIADNKGFKRMLDYVSTESEEFKGQIERINDVSKNKFIAATNNFIDKLKDPNEDIKTLIKENKSKQRDLSTILSFNITNEERERIVLKTMRYYADRLKQDNRSSSISNIDNMLTDNEILFMIGRDNFDRMKTGAKIDIYEYIRSIIAPYRSNLDLQSKNKFTVECLVPIREMVKKYEGKFMSKRFLATEPGIGNKNGEEVKITSEMVDMAVHYARVNKLYSSNYTIEKILKAIVDGEIDNSKETQDAKQKLQAGILKDLKECENIEDYLKTINPDKSV